MKKDLWFLEDDQKYPIISTKKYKGAKLTLKKVKKGYGVFILCEDEGAMQVNCELTPKLAFKAAKKLIDEDIKYNSVMLVCR